ncbi:MAG: toxin-antitoxin system, toxin component, PIN family protein [Desulfamplus sp.]|nr:toxin-antitoxin system, toxin component, PIN family protein [Desulfamplus sp.]
MYAYDAYVLECAEQLQISLVTLDNKMKEAARQLGISIIEV